MRAGRGFALAGLLCAVFALAGDAAADVSVWGRARQPDVAKRKAQLDAAEQHLLRYERQILDPLLGEAAGGDLLRLGNISLIEARKVLEDAGGAKSPDMRVRLRLGYVLRRLAQGDDAPKVAMLEEAMRILLTVAGSNAPPSIKAAAWNELALGYAVLGQRENEVHAETEALALEPIGRHRAVLLANRAEAYMGLGRLEEAIGGYRESIRSLVPIEMFDSGVTALWGLGVALDRDGDLDGGLASIQLARAYDRDDRRIHGSSWFFSPPHDEHWYDALGFWAAARTTDQGAVRAESYASALAEWDAYLARAPADDRWLPLARARREACAKEGERALQAARKKGARERPDLEIPSFPP
jgi:tetratricopeptide (TPR) repeat protein